MSFGQLAVAPSGKLTPLGFEQVTAGFGAAQSLPNVPDGAEVALIQVDGNAIRWRDDGTAPTATVGMFLCGENASNQPHEVLHYIGDLSAFEFIADTIGNPTRVNIAYYAYD